MKLRLACRSAIGLCGLVLLACGGQPAGATGTGATGAGTAAPDASGSGTPGTTPGATALPAGRIPTGDWTQFDHDAQRSGTGPSPTGIRPGNLRRLRLRTVRVDGIVDSSAVELHDVAVHGARHDLVAVTTSYGRTIAIDPRTGRKLWEFRPSGVNSTPGNPQVTTATPIVDPDRRYIYSASPNGVIHKLVISSGRQVWQTRVTLDATHEKIASSLNISGPWVVVVTGGYIGDAPPYDGHVVTIDRSSGRIDHVFNTECSNRHTLIRASSCPVTNTQGDNAIWGRAGAVIEPGSGRILVATGNGPFNGRTSWGDSVLELSPDAGTLLHNWTPPNQRALDEGDVDIGSASPALLPPFHGWRLAVQGGKDGRLHLLNLAALDGTNGPAGPRLGGELDEVAAPGGGQVLPQPAAWNSHGQIWLFAATGSGTAGYQLVGARHPRLVMHWQRGTAGTSPVIAGGLLYVYDPGGGIDVRRPRSGALLRRLPAGSGHWNSPIVVGGRIIEPTGAYGSGAASSTIDIYHLPGR